MRGPSLFPLGPQRQSQTEDADRWPILYGLHQVPDSVMSSLPSLHYFSALLILPSGSCRDRDSLLQGPSQSVAVQGQSLSYRLFVLVLDIFLDAKLSEPLCSRWTLAVH
ncbi:hypothetical protein L249_3973 [Ophiocordyceps polyrhachis-furcata BCC 54312]|uniref:Uncharacterized protein n=1 Tax=Ophiocordyceps polyrhachis-furcata BCC 54312 TaxID=1330021 RepID=A0A367L5I5_9HYPO|nr:hypothetical protein L249_3973 [Ophiocordyceps polyrhachis-furcata BCC 54312]